METCQLFAHRSECVYHVAEIFLNDYKHQANVLRSVQEAVDLAKQMGQLDDNSDQVSCITAATAKSDNDNDEAMVHNPNPLT